MPEIKLFFEKAMAEEFAARADMIEDVAAGIGGTFGGFKELRPMLQELRGDRRGRK